MLDQNADFFFFLHIAVWFHYSAFCSRDIIIGHVSFWLLSFNST